MHQADLAGRRDWRVRPRSQLGAKVPNCGYAPNWRTHTALVWRGSWGLHTTIGEACGTRGERLYYSSNLPSGR